jgi:hypothetical protein
MHRVECNFGKAGKWALSGWVASDWSDQLSTAFYREALSRLRKR